MVLGEDEAGREGEDEVIERKTCVGVRVGSGES